ncbi:tRNA-binding protein [Vibrio metoecus]|uniref:tRNA-binding protein n=1 Tax=Vibrio metoecus TaxID=1481663 RepID=UPI00272D8DCE|nr:tRNA-binding protein [Vibrio metoecus]WKY93629.1 tRNA-binding protein [Vibrio metoecus]
MDSAFLTVGYDDFARLDLRIGTIIEVKPHPRSTLHYIVQIEVGEQPLQTVTALAPYYAADALLHQQVVVLCNLKPSLVVGVQSQCMLLCAETQDGEESVLLTPQRAIASGVRIV